MKFAISRPKMGDCHETKIKYFDWIICLNVAVGFDLDQHIDFKFSSWKMELALSQPKRVQLPWNEKQVYRLYTRPQLWPLLLTLAMTLTLKFQDHKWNSLYLMIRWSDCDDMKNGRVDWILGLTCSHQFWRWSWSWFKIFMVNQDEVQRSTG